MFPRSRRTIHLDAVSRPPLRAEAYVLGSCNPLSRARLHCIVWDAPKRAIMVGAHGTSPPTQIPSHIASKRRSRNETNNFRGLRVQFLRLGCCCANFGQGKPLLPGALLTHGHTLPSVQRVAVQDAGVHRHIDSKAVATTSLSIDLVKRCSGKFAADDVSLQ